MSEELPKAYEPKNVDGKWYAFWEKHNLFHADVHSTKPSYCIVIPPPNVTGVLHMGHALVNTLQDVLIRYKRMSGYEVLWVPGVDHAGISTQTVVERKLLKETGKSRKQFSREEFLEHIWKWKDENEELIINQLKRLGCSCDWERKRFTLDEGNNRAVRCTFKRLFDDGLIYRGSRLVNWDPVTQTALADDEVEYEERAGTLWRFRYPLVDGTGYADVATTRPETMLGDTAVAVSPKDARYAKLVGKKVRLPLMDREIPIVADQHVDPEFGTGMVKVTPAHDPNDYEIGLRHNLPFINVMTPDGRINQNGGSFAGMTREEARVAVVEQMKQLGLLIAAEPHTHRVGLSYRSKAVVEPYLSKQWFVKMDGFAKKLQKAVRSGDFRLIPKQWESTYFHWVDNLRDWCISRQLWWGHRIPVWYHIEDDDRVICYEGEGLPPEVQKDPKMWRQDDDVLDTWFSSALWPFATLGWPEKTPELKRFYPNSVLVTGHDILFFWVARMLVMGEYIMGELPFPESFLHGLIFGKSYWRKDSDGGISYVSSSEQREFDMGKALPKDVSSKWEKMSKSKGNVIDPIEIIDEFGTDALRMALCASPTQLPQIDLDRRRFEEYKNFANKLWNGARFIFMNLEANLQSEGSLALTPETFAQGLDSSLFDLEDRWIVGVLDERIAEVRGHIESYAFDRATVRAYDFFWNEFCAYYLELAKPTLFGKVGTPEKRLNKQRLLACLLCASLRLMHPMAPFITEELFQRLKERLKGAKAQGKVDTLTQQTLAAFDCTSCMVSAYPEPTAVGGASDGVMRAFELVSEVVYSIRNIRGEMNVPPGQGVRVVAVGTPGNEQYEMLARHRSMVQALVRVECIEMAESAPTTGFFSTGVVKGLTLAVQLPDDLLAKERDRLVKTQEKLEKNLERVDKQLSNEDFISRAPEQLVTQQRELLNQTRRELDEVRLKLLQLK